MNNLHVFLIVGLVLCSCLFSCTPQQSTNNDGESTNGNNAANDTTATATATDTASTGTNPTTPNTPIVSGSKLSADEAQKTILLRDAQTISAIANGNFEALAALVHPQKGVQFAPYTHLSKEDQTLNAAQIAAANTDTKTYHWGTADGSGDPIEMTIKDYFKAFVYNKPYANKAQKISYNTPIATGNAVNNQREMFPDAIIVEYHIEGTKQYEGMDWNSLYLLYEQAQGGQWYVSCIAHGKWTS